MALINIAVDMNEVVSEFPVLPLGEYLMKYEKPSLDNSKNSGKPVLKTRIVTCAPTKDINGKDIPVGRASVMESISLDPNAPFTLKNRLLAANVPFKVENKQTIFDPDHFLGKEVIVSLVIKELEGGRKVNNIASMRRKA
jgi:hypothetical protein